MLERMADNVRAAIAADPLDATSRRVLSDLLEDVGDYAGAECERVTAEAIDTWNAWCARRGLVRVASNIWETPGRKTDRSRRYSFHLDTGYARRYYWRYGEWCGTPVNPRDRDTWDRRRARSAVTCHLFPNDLAALLRMLSESVRRDMARPERRKGKRRSSV